MCQNVTRQQTAALMGGITWPCWCKSPRERGMFSRQRGLCCYCGEPMAEPAATKGANRLRNAVTREHTTPRSRGGAVLADKLSCQDCNALKGSLTDEEFAAAIKELIAVGGSLRRGKRGILVPIERRLSELRQLRV